MQAKQAASCYLHAAPVVAPVVASPYPLANAAMQRVFGLAPSLTRIWQANGEFSENTHKVVSVPLTPPLVDAQATSLTPASSVQAIRAVVDSNFVGPNLVDAGGSPRSEYKHAPAYLAYLASVQPGAVIVALDKCSVHVQVFGPAGMVVQKLEQVVCSTDGCVVKTLRSLDSRVIKQTSTGLGIEVSEMPKSISMITAMTGCSGAA